MIEISDEDIKYLAVQVEEALRTKDKQGNNSLLAEMTANQITWSSEAWLTIVFTSALVCAYLRGRGLPQPDPDNVAPSRVAIETDVLTRVFIFAINHGDGLPNMHKGVGIALLDADIALRMQE